MDISRLFRVDHNELNPYDPVIPPETLAEISGIPENDIIKLNANENPYGPSPRIQEALGSYDGYHIYPDPRQKSLRKILSSYVGISDQYILAGAGADEIIDLILRACLNPGDEVVNCPPTFGMYEFSTNVNGGKIINVGRNSEYDVDISKIRSMISPKTKVVFLTSPNNPTGNLVSRESVLSLLEEELMVVVDEAYFEFSGITVAPLVVQYPNLVVLRSMSKWSGLAGLRLGYGIMDPVILDRLMDIKQPYNITAASLVALEASLEDIEYLTTNINTIIHERDRLFSNLLLIEGLHPWKSNGNFILFETPPGKAVEIFGMLASRGIFVRYFNTPRLADSLRISVGKSEHMDIVVRALTEIMESLL